MLTPSEICELVGEALLRTAILIFIAGCAIGAAVIGLLHLVMRHL
jgi:hypothetical protein